MIPISSADQFLTFLEQLREFTDIDYLNSFYRFRLYAKFPEQQNSVIDYGLEFNENGFNVNYHPYLVMDCFMPYLNNGLVPYYIKETTTQTVNGSIINNERTILTYVPASEVKFYGVEIQGNYDYDDSRNKEFLTWKEAKEAKQKA